MSEQTKTEKGTRDELIAARDRLYKQFLKNPMELRLASEIKVIDDRVAECNERIRTEHRKASLSEKKEA